MYAFVHRVSRALTVRSQQIRAVRNHVSAMEHVWLSVRNHTHVFVQRVISALVVKYAIVRVIFTHVCRRLRR